MFLTVPKVASIVRENNLLNVEGFVRGKGKSFWMMKTFALQFNGINKTVINGG